MDSMKEQPKQMSHKNLTKARLSLKDSDIRATVYNILQAQGVSNKDITKALGLHEISGYKIKRKLVENKSLATNTTLVSLAQRNLKKLMQGKTFGDIKDIKDSTALRALEVVLDRAEPKVNHNLNANVEIPFHPVDLSKFEDITSDNYHDVKGDATGMPKG